MRFLWARGVAVLSLAALPLLAQSTAAATVATGASHTVVVDAGGNVWTWGLNTNGQLGTGDTSPRSTPVSATGLSNMTAVSAGTSHSLALAADGTVWAWGHNAFGQLGDGTLTQRLTPVQVVGLSGIVAVEAGDYQSFAIAANGSLWAWGRNASGQLGDGTATQRTTPVSISALSGVVGISSGYIHTLAITSAGSAYAWGNNGDGRLGDGTTTARLSPVLVTGLSGVTITDVSAGSTHSLAVTSTGALYAWGNNGNGRLGDGTLTHRWSPVLIAGLTDVVAVSAGLSHSSARRSDGGVWGWGYNNEGPIGDGTRLQRTTPVQTVGPSSVAAMSSNSAGQHAIAITADQSVWGWGYNLSGQVGDGTSLRRELPVKIAEAGLSWRVGTPVLTPGTGTYTSAQSIAITSATTGAQFFYTTDGSEPSAGSVPYTGPFSVATFTTVKAKAFKVGMSESSTSSATYTMNLGTLAAPTVNPAGGTYVMGVEVTASSIAGATIRYSTTSSNPTATSPVLPSPYQIQTTTTLRLKAFHPDWTSSPVTVATYTIETAAPVFDLASGSYPAGQQISVTGPAGASITYTLNGLEPIATDMPIASGSGLAVGNFVLKAKAWTPGCSPSAVTMATYEVTGAYGPGDIVAGGYHSVATRPDGAVWAWGYNASGQLGAGNLTPTSLAVQVRGLTGVKAVTAGVYHSLALKSDGTVWSWGHNSYGQIGDGNPLARSSPVRVPALSGIVSVAAGDYHNLALAADGTVYAWGYNLNGQVGDGTTTNRFAPVALTGLGDVSAIAAGAIHSVAVTTSGAVYAWGSNGTGRLGDGTTTNRLTPTLITGVSDVVDVSAGNQHTLALTAGGALYAWGNNGNGRLGDGTTVNRLSPVLVSALGNTVSAMVAGIHSSYAVKADGTAWAWGQNAGGQLGDGTTTQRFIPVSISGLPLGSAIRSGAAGYHGLAIAPDQGVWAWGTNANSRLGDGTTVNRLSPIKIAEPVFQWKAGTPVFSPLPGNFTDALNVTLASATVGATFTYTTDGSDPTASSAPYTGPITVTTTSTLRARAFSPTAAESNITVGTYFVSVPTPQIAPPGGTYSSAQSATITSTITGGSIRYTADGSEPTPSSPVYTEPLSISTGTTLKAKAFTAAGAASATTTAVYVLDYGPLDAPTLSPPGGIHQGSVTVSASSAVPGTTLRFTVDGSEPAISSNTYAAPLTFTEATTLKVTAFHVDWSPSPAASATYVIQTSTVPIAPTFNPAGGVYENIVAVTLSHPEPGVVIRYSLNSEPDANSTIYTTPVLVNQSNELVARAYRADGAAGTPRGEQYDFFLSTPTFSPDGGTYFVGQEVVISGPAETELRYTTDGDDPTYGDAPLENGGSIRLQAGLTLKAKAFRGGTADSEVKTATYDVTGAPPQGHIASGRYVLACKPDGTLWVWNSGAGSEYPYLLPTLLSDLTGVRAVAVGSTSSVVSKMDGTVWTRGSNAFGQLGNGPTPSSSGTPVNVETLSGVEAVAAGASHVLALSGGNVWAWGLNDNGQLGNGDSLRQNKNQPVSLGLTGVVAVAGGAKHSLALKDDGSVLAWGDAALGQVGAPISDQLAPVTVAGLPAPATAVAAGGNVSLALLQDGTVWAWGAKPTAGGTSVVRTPQQIAGLNGVQSIAVGSLYAVISRNDGTVWRLSTNWVPVLIGAGNINRVATGGGDVYAFSPDGGVWGWGARIGDGTSATRTVLTKIAEPEFDWLVGTPTFSSLPGAYEVSSKDVVISTVTAGATIHYTTDGSIPDETSPGFVDSGTVTIVDRAVLSARAFLDGAPASNVTTGEYILQAAPPVFDPPAGTVAGPVDVTVSTISADAIIRCTTNGVEPTEQDARCDSGTVRIATSTTLWAKAWAPGRLTSAPSFATYNVQAPAPPPPTFSPAPGTYTRLTTVTLSTTVEGAAIRFTTDGTEPTTSSRLYRYALVLDGPAVIKAKAFMRDMAASEAATGVYVISLGPVAPPSFDVEGGTYVTSRHVTVSTITPGATIRYTTDGREPTEADPIVDSLQPLLIDRSLRLKARAFKDGAASSTRAVNYSITGAIDGSDLTVTLALKADGTVWSWGYNTYGQLGRPGGHNFVPAQITALADVTAVGVGRRHCIALKADGTVWAWGNNEYGQLGEGAPAQTTTPRQVPELEGIVAIAAGYDHSLALDAGGHVWSWGANHQGELGVAGPPYSAEVVELWLDGVTAIGAGSDGLGTRTSVALKSDGAATGTVWTWGGGITEPVFAGLEGMVSVARDGARMAVDPTGVVHPFDGWWLHGGVAAIPSRVSAVQVDGTVWHSTLSDGSLAAKVTGGGVWIAFPHVLEVTGVVRAWTYGTLEYTPGAPLLVLVDNPEVLGDPDNDGLPTWRELKLQLDPYHHDSNGDGISDGAQLALGQDPLSLDLDGDGLSNSAELEQGTNPMSADTDEDGAADDVDCAPLNSAVSTCPPDPSDTTPPRITLTIPRGLTPISVQPE